MYVCTCIYVHVCVCTCIYVHVCVYVCVHIHIHMYMYIYVCVHVYNYVVYEEIPAPNGEENPLYEELAEHQELYADVTDSNIIHPSSPSPSPPPVPVVVPVTNIPITRQLNGI